MARAPKELRLLESLWQSGGLDPASLGKLASDLYFRVPAPLAAFVRTALETLAPGDELAPWLSFWLSWAEHCQGNFCAASAAAETARQGLAARGDRNGLFRALNSLMVNSLMMGDLDRAVKLSTEAEALAEDLGSEELLRTVLINTAKLYIRIGAWDDAWVTLTRGLLMPRSGPRGDGPALLGQAECLLHQGNRQEAADLISKALGRARDQDNWFIMAEGLTLQARIFRLEGRRPEAAEAIKAARTLARRMGDRYRLACIDLELGLWHRQGGGGAMALRYLRRALATARDLGVIMLTGDIHRELAECLQDRRPREALAHFQEFHRIELTVFTQRSTKAIEQERQRQARSETESYRQLYQQIATISAVGQEVTAHLEFSRLVETLRQEIQRIMPADTLGLALLDEDQKNLTYSFFLDQGTTLPEVSVPVESGRTLGAWCLRHGKPVFSNNIVEDWPRFLDFEPTFPADGSLRRSVIFIPLATKGQNLGVLSVQAARENAFTSTHMDALRALGSYVAVALENARLFQAVQYRATYDMLTGILNRPAIFERGEEAFTQLRRYGGDLSILMVDVDHFKMINDTYGHVHGDMVIREVARVLGEHLRDTDFLGRYGGEEFLLILPHTDEDGAEILAERIRVSMEGLAIQGSEGRSHPCTISVGIHGVRVEDGSFEQAIILADRALYWCKEHGRNRCQRSRNLKKDP